MIEGNKPVELIKPAKLSKGGRIAAVSLSFGGPGQFPHRYRIGKKQLEDRFGVTVVETRHALREPQWLKDNPEARAEDLMAAFADDSIDGIISTIGGDDSIRTLPFMDLNVIRSHPKVFMGYSDTTITHLVCHAASLVSFYGPAIMAGFGENGGMFPYMAESVDKALFSSGPIGAIPPNPDGWSVEFLDWGDPGNQEKKRKLIGSTGWKFHQDDGVIEGPAFGGCLEVLDWARGTQVWPRPDRLDNAVLFLETSEEAPAPAIVARFIRSLAAMGELEKLSGILLGRPGGQLDPVRFVDYEKALVDTVRLEYGLKRMPIVTNLDFGHTDPMFVIPMGVNIRIDSGKREISIPGNAVVERS
jgi:muramoyltetrapeptide carboxypeptidase LdcA involved in peptidoglycan recycling